MRQRRCWQFGTRERDSVPFVLERRALENRSPSLAEDVATRRDAGMSGIAPDGGRGIADGYAGGARAARIARERRGTEAGSETRAGDRQRDLWRGWRRVVATIS
jgi:hypothetical protein